MTLIIKRIPIGPLVKICLVLYFILAFIGVLLYSSIAMSLINIVSGLIGGADMPLEIPTGLSLIFMGFFGAVFLSVLYTVITVIAALLYNVIAGFVGGLEAEVETMEVITLYAEVESLRTEVNKLSAPSKGPEDPEL